MLDRECCSGYIPRVADSAREMLAGFGDDPRKTSETLATGSRGDAAPVAIAGELAP